MDDATREGAMDQAHELEAVFAAMADGVIVYDAEGRIVRANPTARALLGLDARPGASGRTARERGAQLAMRDEGGRPLTQEEFPVHRVLRGETLTGAHAVDVQVRALDGREWLASVSAAPVRDAAGGVIGVVAICRDVTQRRRLERRTTDMLGALFKMAGSLVLTPDDLVDEPNGPPPRGVARRLVELAQDVLGSARVAMLAVEPGTELPRPVAVIGLDEAREREWWSAWGGGYTATEVFGRKALARLRAGEAVLFDLRTPAFHDRRTFGMHVVLLVPMRVGDALIGIVGVEHQDPEHAYTQEEQALARAVAELAAMVVERSRLLRERAAARANELALREANRRMDEFLGIVSHELRQPLASVRGYVQLAARRLQTAVAHAPAPVSAREPVGMALADACPPERPPERPSERPCQPDVELDLGARLRAVEVPLERATEQMGLLNRLIGDLLDASRIQRGKLEMLPTPCDLAEVVARVIEHQRQAHPERAIGLEMPAGDPIRVLADASRIEQVITNYVSNALKYAPAGRPVEVRLTVKGAGENGRARVARVSVRDRGPGLAPGEQVRIWERFYRASGAESRGMGLGLGLYISRMIVERHGGAVGVLSAPGAGATFWFTLPLASPVSP